MSAESINEPEAPSGRARVLDKDHLRQERLGQLGDRVARVAHEINKPVSLIAGSLDNLEQHLSILISAIQSPEGQPADGRRPPLQYALENAPLLLAICREGTARLTHVVHQLKQYTRGSEPSRGREELDLRGVVDTAVAWACQGRETAPRVVATVDSGIVVMGDGASLTEAFVNLLSNAFDALTPLPHGCVWVTARPSGVDGLVEVRVRDNGPGVPGNVRARVFDAFFTTKCAQSGLGLGLAISRDIIERHGGALSLLESSRGGAEFMVQLPARGLDA